MVLAFAEGNSIQLVPDGTIIIHIALILIMIWILNRTFFRPINKVLAARDKNKGGHSSEAAETLKVVESKLAQYNTATREARTEGYQLIENERAAALAEREARLESVKSEVEQKVAQEKAGLQTQAEEARRTISAESQKLAEKISSNILRA